MGWDDNTMWSSQKGDVAGTLQVVASSGRSAHSRLPLKYACEGRECSIMDCDWLLR